MGRRCVVRVPASSANLGPGFDAFAAALGLHLEAEVEETGRFAVETDLAIASDRRNLMVRGFARLHPPDDFTFTIRSDIPLSGGLGSSAAAYVGGLLAAVFVRRMEGAGRGHRVPSLVVVLSSGLVIGGPHREACIEGLGVREGAGSSERTGDHADVVPSVLQLEPEIPRYLRGPAAGEEQQGLEDPHELPGRPPRRYHFVPTYFAGKSDRSGTRVGPPSPATTTSVAGA